jgi:DNA-binding XRE family transcriptional regulator
MRHTKPGNGRTGESEKPPVAREERGRAVSLATLLQNDPEAIQVAAKRTRLIDLGRMLREVRERRGLSQGGLAERTGLTQAQISLIERGMTERGPTWETICAILDECGEALVLASSLVPAMEGTASVAIHDPGRTLPRAVKKPTG